MSNPKRPAPEQVATQIATTLPGGHGSGPANSGRTAALPQAPVPLAAPTDRTMTFDPNATIVPPRRHAALPTMMSLPQEQLPPAAPARRNGAGRWVGGPLLALVVGVVTVLIAGAVSGGRSPPNLGRLRVSSDPDGALVLVDGKVQAHRTPTVIEGEIGATLHVSFRLDDYTDKETDVLVSEGERPFRAHLDPHDAAPPKLPDPEPETLAPLVPPSRVPVVTKEDHKPKKESHKEHVVQVAQPQNTSSIAPPLTGGTGTVSVHVRPWAIVYVDGAKIRQTPVNAYSLTAGLHVVELVNDGLNKREKITIDVRASNSEDIRRDWDK